MANTLQHAAAARRDSEFRDRVAAALTYQAMQVRQEAANVQNHDARATFALNVLYDRDDYISQFVKILSVMAAVITPYDPGNPLATPNPILPTYPNDSILLTAVSNVWNNLTGV